MRISDWSSDVCSSDLALSRARAGVANAVEASATARASFRIVFPFQYCHKGLEKLPNPKKVSVQGHNSRSCCLNRSEEHTSELQSLMRISYHVFFFITNKYNYNTVSITHTSSTLSR